MPALTTAPLKRRLASLVYELLLTAAVTCVAMIPAGIAATVLGRIWPPLASMAVCIIIVGGWWLYFRANWQRRGQTLPMRVWQIGLADDQGRRPPLPQLRLRFMWACVFVVFVPLLAYVGLRHFGGIPPKAAFGAALIWWILPWGFALLNQERRFLYDYLAGTRLVDVKKPRKPADAD